MKIDIYSHQPLFNIEWKVLVNTIKREKEMRGVRIRREEEKPTDSTETIRIKEFGKVARYKVNL